MTHVTCRLTVKNWDQLRNPTLSNRVWATFFTRLCHKHRKWNISNNRPHLCTVSMQCGLVTINRQKCMQRLNTIVKSIIVYILGENELVTSHLTFQKGNFGNNWVVQANFLQARCHSCHLTNSIKPLEETVYKDPKTARNYFLKLPKPGLWKNRRQRQNQ